MRFRASLAPTVQALRDQGLSYRAIALRLDQNAIPSPSGRGWNHMTVRALLGNRARQQQDGFTC